MSSETDEKQVLPGGASWAWSGAGSLEKVYNEPGTILVVDDSETARHMVVGALSKQGHRTYQAEHGRRALEILKRHKDIELLVCDLEMPILDGLGLIKFMAAQHELKRIPVIMVSSVTQSEKIVECLENGALDFIRKPFHSAHLQVRVRNTLALTRTLRSLQTMAHCDPLTGVYNLRMFEEMLRRDLAFSVRRGKKIGVIMADLDHFKRVNDTYGHQVGDEVLQEFARRAQSQVRKGDLLARYGGEEFTFIANDADAHGAVELAERVRKSMEEPVSTSKGEVEITVSLGVAVNDPQNPETADELIERADQSLYKAKDAGRNRVVLSEG